MEKIRITVKSDFDESKVLEQKLKLKGYEVTVNRFTRAVLDGTDLGGHFDYLRDIDDEVFVVIGTK